MLVDGWAAGGLRRGAIAAGLLLLCGVLGVTAARAACGGVAQEKPRKDVNLGRAPIAIGDSPMLLALPNLAAEGYRANARGCRQWPEGLDLIRKLRRKDRVPRLVVVALGSNGSVSRANIHDALRLLKKGKKKRTLGLVTPRESGGGSSSDADVVRSEAKRHPNRIVLLDWVKYSSGHSGWFQPDGLHLTFDGADAFARLLKKPLKALPKPR